MREELPALTTWQQIGLIMATPSYDDGEAFLDEGDMTSVAVLLDTYKAERDAERDDLREEVALLKRRMCCCCLEVTNDNVLCEVCYEDRIA